MATPSDKRLPQAHRAAKNAEELMALADTDFIYCAYWTLLGRAADPDGLSHFRSKLRSGIAKADILLLLSRSAEGKAHGILLPDLLLALKRQALARHPLLGFHYRRRFRISKDDAATRQVNMLENRVLAVTVETCLRLADLEHHIGNIGHVGSDAAPARPKRGLIELVGDRPVSHRVAQIFSLLTAAIKHEDVEPA